MTCSQRNFMASQALYGIMIAYPRMSEDNMITKAYRISDKMLKESRKKKEEIRYGRSSKKN